MVEDNRAIQKTVPSETGLKWSEVNHFYTFLKLVGIPLLKVFFRVRGEGRHHIPSSGPCIVVANHSSYLDPVMLGATCPRPIHFIMLREYWEKPLLGWICRKAGSFPVAHNRPATAALRQALTILRNNQVLGIFPEGGRSPDGRLRPGKHGAAQLALRTGVPLVPAAILGSHRALPMGSALPRPLKINVRYGKPLVFQFPPSKKEYKDRLNEATKLIMQTIGDLARH